MYTDVEDKSSTEITIQDLVKINSVRQALSQRFSYVFLFITTLWFIFLFSFFEFK